MYIYICGDVGMGVSNLKGCLEQRGRASHESQYAKAPDTLQINAASSVGSWLAGGS